MFAAIKLARFLGHFSMAPSMETPVEENTASYRDSSDEFALVAAGGIFFNTLVVFTEG